MDVAAESKAFIFGADKQVEEAGFWQKKFIGVRAHDTDGTLKNTFATLQWGRADDNFQLGHVQDLLVIRFADVLLMQSELKADADGMNKIRARAGLPSKSYSLDAIKSERRFELAFEGRRWADIRRWGDAASLLDRQLGVPIYNRGLPDVMKAFGGGYAKRYEETKGFFPLPASEIDLSEGTLTQTPGWGDAAAEYSGW
jgi:hypothetical protein